MPSVSHSKLERIGPAISVTQRIIVVSSRLVLHVICMRGDQKVWAIVETACEGLLLVCAT